MRVRFSTSLDASGAPPTIDPKSTDGEGGGGGVGEIGGVIRLVVVEVVDVARVSVGAGE
jgi:hypothetical protein